MPINAQIDAALFGAGVSVVTKKTVLGATYGFTVLVAGANNRLQATEIDSNPGAGITDTVLTPISLGWHKKRADATAYCTMYLPTGRYEDGATNNTGLGMWGQEIGFGTTAYLTEDRKFHAATMVSFNFQSQKKDSDTSVGNQMNLEGGVGGDFLGGGLTAGMAYYYCFKITSDSPGRFPINFEFAKANVFALGPDITLALASKKKNTVYGFLSVRYEWELHAEAQTKGGMWLVQAVFPFKPIHLRRSEGCVHLLARLSRAARQGTGVPRVHRAPDGAHAAAARVFGVPDRRRAQRSESSDTGERMDRSGGARPLLRIR